MPTKKPRLAITLSVESRAALERFSRVSGIAASAFVAGLVEDAIPVINATTDAIEIARKSPAKAAAAMNSAVVTGVTQVVQAQLELDAAVKERKLHRRPRK